jgi:hypothetical protein
MHQLLMQNDKDHMHAYAWPSGLPQNGHVVASTPPGSPPARVRNNISARSLGRTRSGKKILVYTAAAAAASAGGSLVSSSSQLVGPGWAPRTTTNFLHKLTIHMLFTLFLRRSSRILLLAPFIYITAMVLYIGGSAMELPARFQTCVHIPGSYYRSDEVFNNLWPAMQQANASTSYGVRPPSLFLSRSLLFSSFMS